MKSPTYKEIKEWRSRHFLDDYCLIHSLNQQEMEVLYYVTLEELNKTEVAKEMHLSPKSVGTILTRIYKKLEIEETNKDLKRKELDKRFHPIVFNVIYYGEYLPYWEEIRKATVLYFFYMVDTQKIHHLPLPDQRHINFFTKIAKEMGLDEYI